jgi:predicted RNase H-like nuclease (RuvC/YqgF family)
LRLATIASSVSTTGHFDKVIKDIDLMIANLRAEEKADIEHRDWCESEQKSAEFKNENLQYDQEQLTQKIERAEDQKAKLMEEIQKTDDEKNMTLTAMAEALETRNSENKAFKQALKDDSDAVGLISQAIEVLSGYYSLLQHKQPEYKENPDTPPETFEGDYEGRKSEGGGIIAILSMIKEDIEKEMKVASEEEAEALKAYEELRADSQATVDALDAKLVSLGQDVAAKMKEIADLEAVKQNKADSEAATDSFLTDLGPNCDWVDKYFDSRMEKRKAEMDGLQEAKAILAGAGAEGPALLTKKASVDDELRDLDETEKKFQRSFLQRK